MSNSKEAMRKVLDKYHEEKIANDTKIKNLIKSSKENKIVSIVDGNCEYYFVAIYCSTNKNTKMILAKQLKKVLLEMDEKDRGMSDSLLFKICWDTNNSVLCSLLEKCILNKEYKGALLKKEKNMDSDKDFIEQTSTNLKLMFSHFHKLEEECVNIDEKELVLV